MLGDLFLFFFFILAKNVKNAEKLKQLLSTHGVYAKMEWMTLGLLRKI